jgi:hypothetical protein
MLRRDDGERTEFITLSLWDSENAIRAFAGDDIEAAVLYPEDSATSLAAGRRSRTIRWSIRCADSRQHCSVLAALAARYPVNRPRRTGTIARHDGRFSSDLGKRASRSTPSRLWPGTRRKSRSAPIWPLPPCANRTRPAQEHTPATPSGVGFNWVRRAALIGDQAVARDEAAVSPGRAILRV